MWSKWAFLEELNSILCSLSFDFITTNLLMLGNLQQSSSKQLQN